MSLIERLRLYAATMKAMGNEVIAELLEEAADVIAAGDTGRKTFGFTNVPV